MGDNGQNSGRQDSTSAPATETVYTTPSGEHQHHHLVAVYPGTFDPVHRGHLDIARRAARLVDELVVAVYATPSKNLLFTTEERIALWNDSIAEAGLANVRVEPFEGLIVDFARRVGAQATVRGLRAVT